MGTIRFTAPGFSRVVRHDPAPTGSRTLLDIARERGIPILFNCEAGGCAACIVRVEPTPGAPLPALTFEEEFLLKAMGKLDERIAAGCGGAAPCFRLACQYVVGDEDIVVDFTNEPADA
ncbi:MAG: (2Fe-2S)-binding protein [Rhodospirillales bacterium]|nr:(2Fe-2S)-binding protein [Rhodospirillales bacterium]